MNDATSYTQDTRTEVNNIHVLRHFLFICGFLLVGIILIFSTFFVVNSATANFPENSAITIGEGESLDVIGRTLEAGSYIHSSFLFKLLAEHLDVDVSIKAGTYTFSEPLTTHDLILELVKGSGDHKGIRATFPEGFRVRDFALYTDTLFTNEELSHIDANDGKLFPDTYYVSPDEEVDSLVKRMHERYEETIRPLRAKITERGYTEDEVIILASILEREANDETSMRTVAGILENRLRDDMPLQVDAVFEYYTGKSSAELATDDLMTDTPYNTYTNLGLPPEPIGNPGLMAIQAVLNPLPSDFYYYLTGKDGKFYYAKTHEEHVRNKARYLR